MIGRCSLVPTSHCLQGKCASINLSQAASGMIVKTIRACTESIYLLLKASKEIFIWWLSSENIICFVYGPVYISLCCRVKYSPYFFIPRDIQFSINFFICDHFTHKKDGVPPPPQLLRKFYHVATWTVFKLTLVFPHVRHDAVHPVTFNFSKQDGGLRWKTSFPTWQFPLYKPGGPAAKYLQAAGVTLSRWHHYYTLCKDLSKILQIFRGINICLFWL